MFMRFTFVGDNGHAPDCVVLQVNAMDHSHHPTKQRTLVRGTDDGWAFWQRITAAAEELGKDVGCRYDSHPLAVVYCKYGEDAERALRMSDSRENHKLALAHIAYNDPSAMMRVKTLAMLLDMERRTLQ